MAMEVSNVGLPIVERISEVKARGDAYIEGLSVKARQRQRENFAKVLRPVSSQLRDIAQIEGNMRKFGIIPSDEDIFSDYRDLVEDLVAKVKSDDFDIVVLRTADNLGKAIGESLDRTWKRYLEEKIGAVKNTIALLTSITGDTEEVATLRALINTLSQEIPASDRAMRCLERYLAGANRLIEDLQLNDNIREFLIRLTARNATLANMDQEVYDWLMENGFAHKVRILFQ
jgi:hypothetical protein